MNKKILKQLDLERNLMGRFQVGSASFLIYLLENEKNLHPYFILKKVDVSGQTNLLKISLITNKVLEYDIKLENEECEKLYNFLSEDNNFVRDDNNWGMDFGILYNLWIERNEKIYKYDYDILRALFSKGCPDYKSLEYVDK